METDVLLALISLKDKHHADALRLVDSLLGEVKISPYSFIELDLLLKYGEILVEDLSAFYDVLSELLRYRQIDTYPLRFEYHREAFRLRGGHKNLTYFDSLHAAVAIVENLEIVSYDKGYERLTNVKYIHPKKYA
ncbi:MAG: PIN domain-containing protein [Candidatus Bathyarchaeia archaeon]